MHISSLSSSAAGLSLSSPLAITAFLAMAVQGLISSAEIVEHDVSQEDSSQTSPPELVASSLPAGMPDALYPACSHALWSACLGQYLRNLTPAALWLFHTSNLLLQCVSLEGRLHCRPC